MPSKIEWTDETINPVIGCTKIATGCKNCYAERTAHRLAHMGQSAYWPTVAGGNWTGKVVCREDQLNKPLHWRKPRRIFVCSMGDLFHEEVPFRFVNRVFDTIWHCQQHTFLLLTKRINRAAQYFSDSMFDKPQPNVWLGVSCSNQGDAEKNIPILLQIPAAVRFISFEPLLGPIDFYGKDGSGMHDYWQGLLMDTDEGVAAHLDWVIVGGESGPGARPMHPNWPRDIRDQCVEAGVAFFFKQWGKYIPWSGASRIVRLGGSYNPITADMIMSIDGQILEIPTGPSEPANACELNDMIHGRRKAECFDRVGKKKAGRVLDGRTWDEYPELRK